MPRFNEQFLIALKNHAEESYPTLTQLVEKHSLSFQSLLTASMIGKIDNECTANPNILNESLSLVEVAENLSVFFNETSQPFTETLLQIISYNRERGALKDVCLQEEQMREYFMNEDGARRFLLVNPVYIGIYIFLLALI